MRNTLMTSKISKLDFRRTSKDGFTLIETISSVVVITLTIFLTTEIFVKNSLANKQNLEAIYEELIIESVHNEFENDPTKLFNYLSQFNPILQDAYVSGVGLTKWQIIKNFDELKFQTYLRKDGLYICNVGRGKYEDEVWVRKKVE